MIIFNMSGGMSCLSFLIAFPNFFPKKKKYSMNVIRMRILGWRDCFRFEGRHCLQFYIFNFD